MEGDLIFDLGFHNGSDTRFYLGKGFRVMALEANPTLVEKGEQEFKAEIEAGRLTIVNRALSAHTEASSISFFVNDEKDDWSSTNAEWAAKGGHNIREIKVQSISLDGLIQQHGRPYYIKCDIEGEDRSFIEQVSKSENKPKYLSVEGGGPFYINLLSSVGYSNFQIVNQLLHFRKFCPKPALEGSYFDTRFTGLMSGLFGKELPVERWNSGPYTLDVLDRFKQLRALDAELAPGWIDLHAKLDE